MRVALTRKVILSSLKTDKCTTNDRGGNRLCSIIHHIVTTRAVPTMSYAQRNATVHFYTEELNSKRMAESKPFSSKNQPLNNILFHNQNWAWKALIGSGIENKSESSQQTFGSNLEPKISKQSNCLQNKNLRWEKTLHGLRRATSPHWFWPRFAS